jgi:hypothetical protein
MFYPRKLCIWNNDNIELAIIIMLPVGATLFGPAGADPKDHIKKNIKMTIPNIPRAIITSDIRYILTISTCARVTPKRMIGMIGDFEANRPCSKRATKLKFMKMKGTKPSQLMNPYICI